MERGCDTLIGIFDALFGATYNTHLCAGSSEPIYLPTEKDGNAAQVIFAHGFFNSALHEVAHWCLAGEARRAQVDYGYWYAADGRSAAQQREFEHVEVKPQAIEWTFAVAAKRRFQVSCDNLSGEVTDPSGFKQAVYKQVVTYCETGLPARAQQFRDALAGYFGGSQYLCAADFSVDRI